jgi:transcription-repair coupling factor (superfamily II helicase)
VNIREIINQYKSDERIVALAKALNMGKGSKIQLKGLVGSADAMVAVATYFLLHKPQLFILPDREEAAYFLGDLESILDKAVLLFPSSYRRGTE